MLLTIKYNVRREIMTVNSLVIRMIFVLELNNNQNHEKCAETEISDSNILATKAKLLRKKYYLKVQFTTHT